MNLILFDGTCKLCNSFVNYVIEHDKSDQFRFAALQSEVAEKVLKKHNLSIVSLDSSFLIKELDSKNERLYQNSDTILLSIKELGGMNSIFVRLLLITPKILRDMGYRAIAKSRYKVFGRYEKCLIPSKEIEKKFIEVSPAKQ